ncbi:helix-turn-helix domain-containing protein [Amycolatopsis decaplanina]|uniref:Transcriptional regulator n=1 Tax=Amycolatopsis decaplanina DSM 44594 TaxID=1284240 RepID=M2YJS7_9PSEU|nr:LuxR family transcriptional regulator [Amycolatopsis decaplanina]EME54972.1 Transcriptional regulator [Amycolatopsis decaplanina DSM 44594]
MGNSWKTDDTQEVPRGTGPRSVRDLVGRVEVETIWDPLPKSHEGCPATAALTNLIRCTDRLGAIRQAEIALADDSCTRYARCVWHGVTVLICSGELLSADGHISRFESSSDDRLDDVVALLRAQHAKHAGDVSGVRTLLERLISSTPHRFVRDLAVPFLVEALATAGDVAAAEAVLDEYDFDELLAGRPAARPLLLAIRGELHLAAGRPAAALADMLACLRGPVSEVAAHSAVVRRRGVAALAAAADGRSELASALADEEEEAARGWGGLAYVGWAQYVRAMVDEPDRPSRLLNDAIDLLDAALSPAGIAASSYEQGVRLMESGDGTAAREQFKRAGQMARRIGNTKVAELAEKMLGELTQSLQQTQLTAQELKIAEMAQAGYSNKQIAERLVLTVRTIEFHLSNVYRKLGISGRRALLNKTLETP